MDVLFSSKGSKSFYDLKHDNKKEYERFKNIIEKIIQSDTKPTTTFYNVDNIHVKKLEGSKDKYRIKPNSCDYRLIYKQYDNDDIKIYFVGTRADANKIYHNKKFLKEYTIFTALLQSMGYDSDDWFKV